MLHFARTLLLAFTATALTIATAQAADCGKLKMINSVDLSPTENGRMLVPVSINNTPLKMLLSTGGVITTLSRDTVDALKLPLRDTPVKLLDGDGHATRNERGAAHADSFVLGYMKANGLDVLISPNSAPGKEAGYDGYLAGDLMKHYDVEFDFAGRKLNYFSPEHCPDQVVYWPASAISIVPLKGENAEIATHIRIPVTLDGQYLIAEIDTDSSSSSMLAPVAKRFFNVTEADSTVVGWDDKNPDLKIFAHIFSSLSFDGVAVNNPRVLIYPDLLGSKDPDNGLEVGSSIRHRDDNVDRADLHIGMNVLQHLHLYVAFRDKKLYLTAASPQTAAPKP